MKVLIMFVLGALICCLLSACSNEAALKISPQKVYYWADKVSLEGGTPPGGYYQGEGVVNNFFYPSKTQIKGYTYEVEVSYQNSFLGKKAKDKITVFGAPEKLLK